MTDKEIRTKVMNILIQCRKESGLTQEELAEAVGSKPTTVASWEQGRSLPSIPMMYHLSQYYNKTISYMYGEEHDD